MSLNLSHNIKFSREEYKQLFYSNKELPTLAVIKKKLCVRGINYISKARYAIVENYVFNSIEWECPNGLFFIYKMLVNCLSFKLVEKYVNKWRATRYDKNLLNFNSTISGIILQFH